MAITHACVKLHVASTESIQTENGFHYVNVTRKCFNLIYNFTGFSMKMNPSDVARIITDDIDWNASEEEYSGDSDDGEVNNSMRFDLLDMAGVSFC